MVKKPRTILLLWLAGILFLTGCTQPGFADERTWFHESVQTGSSAAEAAATTAREAEHSEESEAEPSVTQNLTQNRTRVESGAASVTDLVTKKAAVSDRLPPEPVTVKSQAAAKPTVTAGTTVPAATVPPYAPRGTSGSETVDRLADTILSQLINGSMTDSEIMSAVFNWVRRQITYSSPASSVYLTGAEAGLRYRRGNCYTRAFTQVALLRRAGINATYNVEYEGRHSWALVGDYVLDTGFNVYMVKESALQDYISGGIYLYRTGPSPRPSTSTESRTVYLDEQTIPYQTYYRLNPDPASIYPNQIVSVAGVNGVTRDQWTHRYENGVRQPSRDLLVEDNQVVTVKVDQIVLVGQTIIEMASIPASAGTAMVETSDPALDGQRVPDTGADGILQIMRTITSLNEQTGEALDFGASQEKIIMPAAPYSVYVYVAPSNALSESTPLTTP